MKLTYKLLVIASLICLIISAVMMFYGNGISLGPPLIFFFLLLAIGVRGYKKFKGFSFTILIFAAVSVSMFYPSYFVEVGDFQLKKLIVPLLQLIMFGMGTAMSIKDFTGVVKMPKGVLIGLACLFTIMPTLGFAFIITIITAAGRDSLLSIGLFLVLAAIIHNTAGYFLGYWGCRVLKMNERDCRTIALEVGMQNGGLASGIALEMGKVSTIGLAPAVFGPWMNISGSSLATWWRDKDLKKESVITENDK